MTTRIGLLSTAASRAGGGVFEAIVAQCGVLRRIGFEPVVIALADPHDAEDHKRMDAEVIAVRPSGPVTIGYAPGLAKALGEARLDLLHLHGIWQYPSAAAAHWAKRTRRPYLISSHGMLDPWIVEKGQLKKALARLAYENRSWRQADAFHALTRDEASDIAAVTGRGDCVVIPNAVEPGLTGLQREPVLAYVGRIHPKKNLEGLVEGWKLARDALAPLGARLRIAGWGADEDVAALRKQITAAGGDDIEFIGPAFGAEKAALLGSARFLALASHSEGLPMGVLDAWATGTPTLMSRHCHLPEGFEAGAALDCGTDPATIADCLRAAARLSESQWEAMSDAGLRLTRETFSPDAVSQRWEEAYSGLLSVR
jgi:poly(glycerol-phosphate) alpha-glucosyltransferase